MYYHAKQIISIIGLLCLLSAQVQAGLFGFNPKDRHEFVQARETYNQGHYPQAVAQLTDYIYKTKNIKRREARAYRLLGMSYEQLNQPERALETYLEALEFHQKDVPLLLAAAALYHRTGLTDQSIALYDRALKIDPTNTEALAGQAENYIHIGFFSKAHAYYDEFFRLVPKAPSINRARYAYAFLKQHNYADALIHITMAKTEDPENVDYWLLSARAYKGLGMTDDALADLDAALLLAPDQPEILAIKALWLYQRGDYTASAELAQELLRQNPSYELAWFIKYLNCQKTGRAAEARKALLQIQALDNDSFIRRTANKLLEKK